MVTRLLAPPPVVTLIPSQLGGMAKSVKNVRLFFLTPTSNQIRLSSREYGTWRGGVLLSNPGRGFRIFSNLANEEPPPDRRGFLRAPLAVDGEASAHKRGAREKGREILRLKICRQRQLSRLFYHRHGDRPQEKWRNR